MAQKHSTQVSRDDERFTTYAVACRMAAQMQGLTVPSPYATATEIAAAVTDLAYGWQASSNFTLPAPPKVNGRYEGNKGHRYNGPSKRTLKRRGSRALRGA